MNFLVTGGAGFVGSHVCVKLLESGHKVLVIDNLSNSTMSSLRNVEKIVKMKLNCGGDLHFFQGDIGNQQPLEEIFSNFKIDVVIHLAGLKSVKESVEFPDKYYENNVMGSINLFNIMKKFRCKAIIFSSSATVYGASNKMPINEKAALSPINPYGSNKKNIEDILINLYEFDNTWHIAILRFFNPTGAHKSGLIGESPLDLPNNLMPYILKVASGELNKLKIFGNDYDTHDGTGVRDYIHVEDIAAGHIQAIEAVLNKPQVLIANLGTGVGYSVYDVINTFQKVTNKKIYFEVSERRDGDMDMSFSDPSFAEEKLGWKASYDLSDMCLDAWNFKSKNIF